ncbi:MAG: DUF4215 domain-containing protein [Trichloromonas sp.]|jgi:cysteine-rich repeat protein|nr:DUF4215 domain-containing protein [Trichloromonas sp.]
MLLFGGYDNQTWEWNGVSGEWTNRTPSTVKPSPRNNHAMVYESGGSKAILFGGGDNQIWEWNSLTRSWAHRTPMNNSPSARVNYAMADDASTGRVFLFGGQDVWDHRADTWEWDGVNWIQRKEDIDACSGTECTLCSSTTCPAGRTGHSISRNTTNGAVIVFGGWVDIFRQDTWEWSPSTGNWNQKTISGIKPPARISHKMAYNAENARHTLFGGTISNYDQDTWEFDGTVWIQRKGSNTAPCNGSSCTLCSSTTCPSKRAGHNMAYDAVRKRIVLFGGDDGINKLNDTWEWDSTNGAWAERNVSGVKPLSRSSHAISYDAGRKKIVLFGGRSVNKDLNDVWEWDGTTGTWKNRTPNTIPYSWPSGRFNVEMAYDTLRDRTVLFGGGVLAGGYLQDTWEWDGGANGRPAHLMETVFASSGASASETTLMSLSANFHVGGTGYTGTNCGAINGAKMMFWNTAYKGGAWLDVAANTASSTTPQKISFTTTDSSLMNHFFFGDNRSINISVVPISTNGCGTDMGSISTDYAEVVVRYSIDPSAVPPSSDIADNYFISTDAKTWHDARQICQEMGGDLVIINSDLEQRNLGTLLDPTKNYWIGATDEATEGDWRWVDGTRFWLGGAAGIAYGYHNWNQSQPDDYMGGQDYARIWAVPGLKWDDASAATAEYYICEFSDEFLTCGDGIRQEYEECDDANTDNTDSCAFCKHAVCGDGYLQAGVEECDDGNAINTDGCAQCVPAVCGDGFVWSGHEQCDDGNDIDTDGCISCVTAFCGDGFVHAGVEECDDANTDNSDDCVALCKVAVCGDGYHWEGVETCDDGNTVNDDYCNSDCSNYLTPLNKVLVTEFGDINRNGWAPTEDICPGFVDLTGRVCSPEDYSETNTDYYIAAKQAYVFFDSNTIVSGYGFEIIYNGETILSYPLSEETYSSGNEYLWVMDAVSEIGTITLKILENGIEHESSCLNDYVSIFTCNSFSHGPVPTDCNIEARYQGTGGSARPPDKTYFTNHIQTRFISDATAVEDGFRLTANGASYQTDPFNNYLDNMDQHMEIVSERAPMTLIFQSFRTERDQYDETPSRTGDYLFIYSCPPQ